MRRVYHSPRNVVCELVQIFGGLSKTPLTISSRCRENGREMIHAIHQLLKQKDNSLIMKLILQLLHQGTNFIFKGLFSKS